MISGIHRGGRGFISCCLWQKVATIIIRITRKMDALWTTALSLLLSPLYVFLIVVGRDLGDQSEVNEGLHTTHHKHRASDPMLPLKRCSYTKSYIGFECCNNIVNMQTESSLLVCLLLQKWECFPCESGCLGAFMNRVTAPSFGTNTSGGACLEQWFLNSFGLRPL